MSKYKKHRDLDFAPIKEIHAQGIDLQSIPAWLPTLSNLKVIDLKNNRIKKVKDDDMPPFLLYLNL